MAPMITTRVNFVEDTNVSSQIACTNLSNITQGNPFLRIDSFVGNRGN